MRVLSELKEVIKKLRRRVGLVGFSRKEVWATLFISRAKIRVMNGKSVRDLWFLKNGGINRSGARANLIELETKFTLGKF